MVLSVLIIIVSSTVMTVETSARVEITVTGLNDSSSSSVEIQSVFSVQRRERWETWVYVMPHSRSNHYVSMLCAQYSKHFCTLGFFTHIMRENRTALANDSRTFYDLIMPTFRLINWFSFSDIFPEERGGCCGNQMGIYKEFGQAQNLSPFDYLSIVMNYTSEGKTVNLIKARYYERLCVNIITVIGFGPGSLKMKIKHKADFAIFVEDQNSFHLFNYYKLRQVLTFDWFKTNIICQDHEWICHVFPPELMESQNSSQTST
ncbi:uncharacterized protein LOC142348790 isoform X2 [Convolutriloba macropyga]|uniref:uncharacterized protein LOC142348790 isoform X2 n=1 Tax=Convolutriloba macropyga TaxID=536237 RepID=UPI003F523A46